MAAFEHTRTQSTGRALGTSLVSFYFSAVAAVVSWNNARITRNTLGKLTLRELDDLGLIPGDIEDIARGTFRR